jgi:hypothetical protein
MQALADELLTGLAPDRSIRIDLQDRGEAELLRQLDGPPTRQQLAEGLERTANTLLLAAMLFPYSQLSLRQLRALVDQLPDPTRARLAETYVGKRQSRRDRPYRAFEIEYPYLFDCVIDFGTYKDLQRHRMTTQLRQPLTVELGFSFPDDLRTAGHEALAREAISRSEELYHLLKPDFPLEAQYAPLHGHHVRWLVGLNDRALHHMLELRTSPQGHPSYRKACQTMYRLVEARNPARAHVMQFVDFNDYQWARADSEARQRVKERELEEKLKKEQEHGQT